MLRATIRTLRIGRPSSEARSPVVESGAMTTAGAGVGAWARAASRGPCGAGSAIASRLAPATRAETLTRELRFAREREPLDQALERLAGLGGVTELVFA